MRVQAAIFTPGGCCARVMPSANLISFLVSSRPPMSSQVIFDAWERLETIDLISPPAPPFFADGSLVDEDSSDRMDESVVASPERSRWAICRYSIAIFL